MTLLLGFQNMLAVGAITAHQPAANASETPGMARQKLLKIFFNMLGFSSIEIGICPYE